MYALFAPSANPPPTPSVPNGPGSSQPNGPLGRTVYAAVPTKSPPSAIIILLSSKRSLIVVHSLIGLTKSVLI